MKHMKSNQRNKNRINNDILLVRHTPRLAKNGKAGKIPSAGEDVRKQEQH